MRCGAIVAKCYQAGAVPFVGVSITLGTHLGLSAVFTVLSLVRSYTLRRLFNRA